MVIQYNFLNGLAVGIAFMDDEDLETMEAVWGFSLFVGPFVVTFYRPR